MSNVILNRLFTQHVFSDMLHHDKNATYAEVVRRFVNDPKDKNNGTIISEIYKYMSKGYRNEYFYQNTLLNKLLIGKHSVKTTTALTQIPINKSKADFILINGKAVVYEIKTELDTFDRLETQLDDYFKAFNHVCVVTSEGQFDRAVKLLENSPVGIYVLTENNSISRKLRKEPLENNSKLDHTVIFKILHKAEFEKIILDYHGKLPVTSQAFFYGECLKLFSEIPIQKAYAMAIRQLKKRNKIQVQTLASIPYELKSLVYFSNLKIKDYQALDKFLNRQFGG